MHEEHEDFEIDPSKLPGVHGVSEETYSLIQALWKVAKVQQNAIQALFDHDNDCFEACLDPNQLEQLIAAKRFLQLCENGGLKFLGDLEE